MSTDKLTKAEANRIFREVMTSTFNDNGLCCDYGLIKEWRGDNCDPLCYLTYLGEKIEEVYSFRWNDHVGLALDKHLKQRTGE